MKFLIISLFIFICITKTYSQNISQDSIKYTRVVSGYIYDIDNNPLKDVEISDIENALKSQNFTKSFTDSLGFFVKYSNLKCLLLVTGHFYKIYKITVSETNSFSIEDTSKSNCSIQYPIILEELDSSINNGLPLIVTNAKKDRKSKYYSHQEPINIDSINILNPDEAEIVFGKKGSNGAFIVYVSKEKEFLSVFCYKRKLKKIHRKL
jgi:hypothetical protein